MGKKAAALIKNNESAFPALRTTLNEEDDKLILALLAQGFSTYQIAPRLNCNQSTVWRRANKLQAKSKATQDFISIRPDVLSNLHSKSLELQNRVYDYFIGMEDSKFAALPPDTKRALLHTAGINANNIHSQERLERNQSTANVASWAVICRKSLQAKPQDVVEDDSTVAGNLNSE